jgi:predicted GH43/DUF377 family glycosyl hydrolase
VSRTPLVRRTPTVLRADPARVVARLFVPGNELENESVSRAGGVVGRVLDLPEDTVAGLVADVRARWGHRHRDLDGVLAASYAQVAHRVPETVPLSEERRTLIAAYFTQEQAVEAAALFNPSLVPHPDQADVADGALRVVMSLRAVGEGHISSVEFRTGELSSTGALTLDDPGPHAEVGVVQHGTYRRALFAAGMSRAGADDEATAFLLGLLPSTFDLADLDRALARLQDSEHFHHAGLATEMLARRLAGATYAVAFPPETTLPERVLRPFSPQESHGLEDARFVRFVDDDGRATYRATYTAFDGRGIAPHLLQTDDFRRFRVSVLAGPAAVDKGMALFPRRVGGVHLALTRSDRETTGVARSDDGYHWADPAPLLRPGRPWDIVQTGNCGSPVETDAGWLVITHGVGAMREYTLGALLLDLDDPTQVVGQLDEPLLRPAEDERDGYVPNVVYSCGALVHGDALALPYGCSDATVRYAVVDLPELLARIAAHGPRDVSD